MCLALQSSVDPVTLNLCKRIFTFCFSRLCKYCLKNTVNGSIIGESDKVKYLGHIICNDNMSDDDDMMRQRRQLYAQGNVLSRRFHMCSLEVKNVLFRTFCTPLYTCQLWSRYTARSLHKLYVAYNNAFRMMHHLPTY